MICVSIAQITVGFYALDRLGLAPRASSPGRRDFLTMVGFALIGAQLVVRNWNGRLSV